MASWKTTFSGVLGALGVALTASSDPTTHLVGTFLAALCFAAFGTVARDNNVTSAKAGAK